MAVALHAEGKPRLPHRQEPKNSGKAETGKDDGADERRILPRRGDRTAAQRGARSVTSRTLDARAGVPTGTAPHRFRNRTELFRRLAHRALERYRQRDHRPVPSGGGVGHMDVGADVVAVGGVQDGVQEAGEAGVQVVAA
ncbi:TetR family transcriptional regulator [Actinomadura sp. J1-007]|nr:TetR family transcriptional regulator [Actinomadura sp. J1-007]